MSKLPEIGLYVSEKNGMRICVENAYGDDPSDFYIVEIVEEANKGDPTAMGDELDKEQWEGLIASYGLVYKG